MANGSRTRASTGAPADATELAPRRDPLRYWLDLGAWSIPLSHVRGREQLSAPYRFELSAWVELGALDDPSRLLREPATLRLLRATEGRHLTGIVTEAYLGASARGAVELGVVLEPRLALARHRYDSRVYRDKSVPDIVRETLAAVGVEVEARLTERYEPLAYCVQREETDLDFVHRLLEQEGIFYFLLESDVVVLGDRPSAYEPMAGPAVLPFHSAAGIDPRREVVLELSESAALTVGRVTSRDFDPEQPRSPLEAAAVVHCAAPSTQRERYDFADLGTEPGAAARRASAQAEALGAAAVFESGRSFCGRLAPGHTFTLTGAPVGVDDGERVVTSVSHDFVAEQQAFDNHFECRSAATCCRPLRRTARPVLHNPEPAHVTGPPGEEIHTDRLGRVKVHFGWDRRQPKDDRCSDWVPVLQDNTGQSSAVPRVGWEVLVHFVDGNPDRPVVLGRLYNGADPPPVTLPQNKSQSTLRSLTTPGGGGLNEILFEDRAGAEMLRVHAQRNLDVRVANDKLEQVSAEETVEVSRDERIEIGGKHRATIGGDRSTTVSGNQRLSTTGSRTLSVGDNRSTSVTLDRRCRIGSTHRRTVGTVDSVRARTLQERVGVAIVEAFFKGHSTEAGRAATLLVGGAALELAGKGKSESTKLARAETIGGSYVVQAGGALRTTVKTARTTTVAGDLNLRADQKLLLRGSQQLEATSAEVVLEGLETIALRVGQSELVLGGGAIAISAPSQITLKVTGENVQIAGESCQN